MGKRIYRQGKTRNEGNDNPLKIFRVLSSCRSQLMAWLARSCPALLAQGTRCTTPLRSPEIETISLSECPVLHVCALTETRVYIYSLLPTITCLRALRAIVWKACSTLIASFALVSKYGMLFLL